jgi:hypothetical protein
VKKVLSTLLIIVMLLGNICYAQSFSPGIARNTYNEGVDAEQYDPGGLHNPQELRDRGHDRGRGHDRDRRHDRGRRHQREHEHRDNDHHVDAGDIITGIVIYEVVKEILD